MSSSIKRISSVNRIAFIPLTAKLFVTFKAGKVFYMPRSSLSFRALISENNLLERTHRRLR